MQIENLNIALWSINFRRKLSNLGDWLALIEQQIANAKEGGADLLVLPEYASEHWLTFAPDTLHPTEEISWMAAKSAGVLAVLQALSTENGIASLRERSLWQVIPVNFTTAHISLRLIGRWSSKTN